jgi:hypothetical protein
MALGLPILHSSANSINVIIWLSGGTGKHDIGGSYN